MAPPPSKTPRPKRAAATLEARLAHMSGADAGELAAWLIKNPAAAAKLAQEKMGVAEVDASKGKPQQNAEPESKKRKRPQMKPLFTSDDEESDDDADVTKKNREASPELSGGADSDYEAGEEGEDEVDGSDDSDGEAGELEREKEEAALELEEEVDADNTEGLPGGTGGEDTADEVLGQLLAGIPGREVAEKPKKKNKKEKKKGKNATNTAITLHKNKEGGKVPRRGAAGDLIVNAAPSKPDFDINLLYMSYLRLQQTQAEQAAHNNNVQKLLTQLLSRSTKARRLSAEEEGPESAAASASAVEQGEAAESELGLLGKLKANPKLLSSAKSPIKLLASDAVNLSLLTSSVPDSELMRSNTMLALRVSIADPEQEELFTEMYEDLIQAHQMDKFRQKRGQIVCAIRAEGTKQYQLPANGTEDWSKVTKELLAGDAYRKEGSDAYGDIRARKVLAKTRGVDVDDEPVPDQIVVTVARLALVEVVLELQFRGVKRLEKPELRMLDLREEVLTKEMRSSDSVVVVAPEDSSVCPARLQSRAAERARKLAEAKASETVPAQPNENAGVAAN